MLEQGLPALVVAEDDADPSIGLARVLTAIDELPDDWDVVTFHSMFGWSDPQPIDDKTFAGEYRICTYRRVNEGAQCYLISAHTASRMLEVAFPVRLPIDELLFRSRPAGLKVYGIEPNPVGEHGFPSELRKRRTPVTETRHAGLRILDGAIVVAGKVDFRLRRRVDQVRDHATTRVARTGGAVLTATLGGRWNETAAATSSPSCTAGWGTSSSSSRPATDSRVNATRT